MVTSDRDSNTTRFNDNYEYTRLHDPTFELGANTESKYEFLEVSKQRISLLSYQYGVNIRWRDTRFTIWPP